MSYNDEVFLTTLTTHEDIAQSVNGSEGHNQKDEQRKNK